MTGLRPACGRGVRAGRASGGGRTSVATSASFFAALLVLAVCGSTVRADDLDACREQFITGHYAECIRSADRALADNSHDEEWWILKIKALRAIGKYAQAERVVEESLNRRNHYSSLRLRVLGHALMNLSGQRDRARMMLYQADAYVGRNPWRYQDAPNLVGLAEMALALGADARQVLEVFLDKAKTMDADYRGIYLVSGHLALDKHDYALAAESFQEGLERFADDPDLLYGLARAFASSDGRRASRALAAALEKNPNHVPALLAQVDHLVDGERYDEAQDVIERILKINPAEPEAWAYRAVIAHIENDPARERMCRERALCAGPTNPIVDHRIGEKLAQKYRFSEGAAYQRRALAIDPAFLPAQIQLAQDLMRLGQEEEGWRLADQVHEKDGYDVAAYNLVTLRDTMASFRTLRDDDFIVRMSAREADIYGQRVVNLLRRAKQTLCAKYGLHLPDPITVEIFPEQKDFAVRTFGMPGGEGFLGVCFGSVITANSPASQTGHPTNWEAVLWHEFCHVVTLTLTRNKMPRWLSEGISVYEERQADPTWGQAMNPQYRALVLGGGLTPVSELSSAFLAPKSPMHLQFAYYESSLVVEFLIDRYGPSRLTALLNSLGAGERINDALARHTDGLEQLEKDFEAFARQRAESLAPAADWASLDLPESPETTATVLAEWLRDHPDNIAALSAYARRLLHEKRWTDAKAPLEHLIELYPGDTSEGNAYAMLAAVHRELEETDDERAVLEKLAARANDVIDTYLRLLELASEAEDWPAVVEHAERVLAVNPLIAPPYRYLAETLERLDRGSEAIGAYRTWLQMDPIDPARVHFRLARLLHAADENGAKRHVMQALEEAPRFRDAQRLLLRMHREEQAAIEKLRELFEPSKTDKEAGS